jgi:host factor-I protein
MANIHIYAIIKEMRQSNMTNKGLNLQDVFLNQARKDRLPLTIFLTNGYQFKGIIRGFDSYIVILETEGRQQLVYKHAISTIVPARPISILDAMEQREEAE